MSNLNDFLARNQQGSTSPTIQSDSYDPGVTVDITQYDVFPTENIDGVSQVKVFFNGSGTYIGERKIIVNSTSGSGNGSAVNAEIETLSNITMAHYSMIICYWRGDRWVTDTDAG